jgi:hypothetical protein
MAPCNLLLHLTHLDPPHLMISSETKLAIQQGTWITHSECVFNNVIVVVSPPPKIYKLGFILHLSLILTTCQIPVKLNGRINSTFQKIKIEI